MLLAEFNIRNKKNLPKEVLYAGEFLEHLSFRFGVDFGTGNAIDKATEQYITYLEFLNERDMRGY